MPIRFEELPCNIYGDFKVGDNSRYNARLLCNLIESNNDGKFNKLIVIQIASLLEAAFDQIFYRARHNNREGVPHIVECDRRQIANKQIDKLAVIIDNLQKYRILNSLDAEIYDDLQKLRKYRNKVHIQVNVDIAGTPRDEDEVFTERLVNWAVDINWTVFNHLATHYERPENIRDYVGPICLPARI